MTLSCFSEFIKQVGSPVTIGSLETKAIISRMKGSDQRVQFRREGQFLLKEVQCGDLVMAEDVFYLVLAVQDRKNTTYAHLGMCNAVIAIQYWHEEQDEYGNPLIAEWATREEGIKAHQTFISARMREEDPGLLSTTVCTFHIPASKACQLLDRIVLGSTKYQVNAIDDISAPGLKILQVSTDERI